MKPYFSENKNEQIKSIDNLSQEELKQVLIKCNNMDEVVENVFGVKNDKRHYFLDDGSMDGFIAEEYDKFGKKYWREKYKLIADEVYEFAPDSKKVLEIGCGSGNLLIELSNKYPDSDVVGIDISDDMLRLAKDNTKGQKNIQLLNFSVYNLNSLEKKPSLVVFRNTLHRLKNAEETLGAIVDFLPDEGKFYLRDIIRDGSWSAFKDRFDKNYPLHNWIKAICSGFTIQELQKILDGLPVQYSFVNSRNSDDAEIQLSKSIDTAILIQKTKNNFK